MVQYNNTCLTQSEFLSNGHQIYPTYPSKYQPSCLMPETNVYESNLP